MFSGEKHSWPPACFWVKRGSSPLTSEYEKGEGDPQGGALNDYPIERQSGGEELSTQFWILLSFKAQSSHRCCLGWLTRGCLHHYTWDETRDCPPFDSHILWKKCSCAKNQYARMKAWILCPNLRIPAKSSSHISSLRWLVPLLQALRHCFNQQQLWTWRLNLAIESLSGQ